MSSKSATVYVENVEWLCALTEKEQFFAFCSSKPLHVWHCGTPQKSSLLTTKKTPDGH